jgi:hypothetical protein
MSGGRLSKMQAEVARQLGPLDGERISGGCNTCDAYQTVKPAVAGVWRITVHHDEECPTLAAMKRRVRS